MFFDHNFTEWFMRQSQTHFALRRYRKKSRAKCCGRTDPFLFCWSFAFLLTLALLVLACNRRRICCQYNHFRGMSYSQFNKRRSNSFPSKARGSDPAISRQTILAFFLMKLIQTYLTNHDSLMVNKRCMFVGQNFGSLRGRTSAPLKIGENLAICKNLTNFSIWGRFYCTLLVDRSSI